jgi:hypothetical protein
MAARVSLFCRRARKRPPNYPEGKIMKKLLVSAAIALVALAAVPSPKSRSLTSRAAR